MSLEEQFAKDVAETEAAWQAFKPLWDKLHEQFPVDYDRDL